MFEIRQSIEMRVPFFEKAVLSLIKHKTIEEKDVCSTKISGNFPSEREIFGSFNYHKLHLLERQTRGDEGRPILVISVRNVLSNLRCGAFVNNRTNGFITVAGEDPKESKRPYHAMGMRKGKLETFELNPRDSELMREYDWIFSGVPVLWDNQVFERMVTECADHSHVWRIPRGNHPLKTAETEQKWKQLHEVFKDSLYDTREIAFEKIMKSANGLTRETEYNLHNVLGIDGDGRLLQISKIGSLEELGIELQKMGAKRALMVDNGGSIAIRLYPRGIENQMVPLLSLPNHRASGTAYLFLQLNSADYQYLWRKC